MTWWNNGLQNIKLEDGEEPPEGFVRGLKRHKKSLGTRRKEIWKRAPKGTKRREQRRVREENKRLREDQKTLRLIDSLISAGGTMEEVQAQVGDERFTDVINEKLLIKQLSEMPIFYKTIFESLHQLYERNPSLLQRTSYEDYLLSL